jgi:hypothetical protein
MIMNALASATVRRWGSQWNRPLALVSAFALTAGVAALGIRYMKSLGVTAGVPPRIDADAAAGGPSAAPATPPTRSEVERDTVEAQDKVDGGYEDYRGLDSIIVSHRPGKEAREAVIRACEGQGLSIDEVYEPLSAVLCSWPGGIAYEDILELAREPNVENICPNIPMTLRVRRDDHAGPPPAGSGDASPPRSGSVNDRGDGASQTAGNASAGAEAGGATAVAAAADARREVAFTPPALGFQSACDPNPGAASGYPVRDPFFGRQWGHHRIGALHVWPLVGAGHRKIRIAIVDTGIDHDHEDLRGNIARSSGLVLGKNYLGDGMTALDLDGHGTHCAGIIAALKNEIGGLGLAWWIELIPYRVLKYQPPTGQMEGSVAEVAMAIKDAIRLDAKVINLSTTLVLKGGTARKEKNPLRSACEEARQHGVIIVCAAGNDHVDITPARGKPSCLPACLNLDNVITVASFDIDGSLCAESNWGKDTVDIAAPGYRICSTYSRNNRLGPKGARVPSLYGDSSGTSMATAYVSGACALILADPRYQGKTPAEVKDLLIRNACKVKSLEGFCRSGGELNIRFLKPVGR